jgi:NADH dehydrogenase
VKLLITGGTGYIGRRLIARARGRGDEIILFGRSEFDLRNPAPLTLPANIDAVIHLAADTTGDPLAISNEAKSTQELLKAAGHVGARFIFISSQTAREDAPTQYGRTKWEIERAVLAAGGFCVRPGLVYGGEEKGLFGTLVKLVEKVPVLPAFLPAPKVQPIHVDDLTVAIIKIAESKSAPSKVFSLGSVDSISFTRFLKSIARVRVRRMRFFLPTPRFLITLLMKLVGARLTSKFGLNRLNSLFDLPVMQTEADLSSIGLMLRSLPSGLHKSGDGRRRLILAEGFAILSYILRTTPRPSLVRRYVRMIEKIRDGRAIGLPPSLVNFPFALAMINERAGKPNRFEAEFQWRIDAATLIAESSRQGAERFLGRSSKRHFFSAVLRITIAVFSEAAWRLVRPFTFFGAKP